MSPTLASSPTAAPIARLFPRLWSIAALSLIVATYRLWFPAPDSFPAIPLVNIGVGIGVGQTELQPLLSGLSVVLVFLLMFIFVVPQYSRRCWSLVAICLVVSFLLDQHRLQPWAYQLAIYAVVFASLEWSRGRRVLILLAASVYIYSGLGKLDFQFSHTVGQDFLAAMAMPLGGLPDGLDEFWRSRIALVFPATELLLGIGILFRTTRRAAGWLLITMHLSLVFLLGPWSLDHSLGVLVWNVTLMIQAYLLFVMNLRSEETATRKPVSKIAIALVAVALIAPVSERAGYWDHWMSWALYAPHTSRVEIEIHESATEQIGPLQPFLSESSEGWHPLSISQWSLAQRGVPVYPQARYQLALAIAISNRYGLDEEIRGKLQGIADRRTGRRTQQRMIGRADLERKMQTFWMSY